MMTGDLFADYHPRWQRSGQSRRAAEEIADSATKIIGQVLEEIRRKPGTFYEIADRMGLDSRVVQPRISDLKERGLVVQAAETGVSPFGRRVSIWKARDA